MNPKEKFRVLYERIQSGEANVLSGMTAEALRVGDVHVDVPLSNFSIGYHPEGMVADQVLDLVPVSNESDKYYTWDREEAGRVPNTLRADGAEAIRVNFSATTDAYLCEEYAAADAITKRQRNNADAVLRLELAKTRRIKDLVMLDLELRTATALTTAANYASGHSETLSGTDQWNNASFTGDIEAKIDNAVNTIRKAFLGRVANHILIPYEVALVFKKNAKIRELIKYTDPTLLTNGGLPPVIFGLKVIVPKTAYVTTRKGAATQTIADAWGKDVIVFYKPENAGLIDEPCFAKRFMVASGEGVYSYEEPSKRQTVYEYTMLSDEKIVSPYGGYLMKAVIA